MDKSGVLAVFGILFVISCLLCVVTGIEFNLTNVGIVTLFTIVGTTVISYPGDI